MAVRKRLTRQESKEATRARLIEAAKKAFIQRGFDDASVEEIAEAAGYSRGAFYSNFADKNELFLAVVDKHRLDVVKALEEMFGRLPAGPERFTAVRGWFANQWRDRDFIVLRMEFSRRAMKNRSIRKRVADMWRQEFEGYAAFVAQAFAANGQSLPVRSETIALSLLAVVYGLGSIAIETGPEMHDLYDEVTNFVFDRLSPGKLTHK